MIEYEELGYRFVRRLSQGRDLNVDEVWSEERRCLCIAKTVRPDRLHPEQLRRLRREGRLLRRFSHPHLVRAYELHHKPTVVVIEEMLGGVTLDALLERRRRLPLVDLANLLDQLCSVVGYLHHHGQLHLDLKPSNVIIEAGRTRLIDLSLAHAPGVGPPGWGTRGYLSPEQATGGRFTSAADVWGLGMIAYVSAVGHNPFGDQESTAGSSGEDAPYLQCSARAPLVGAARRLPKPLREVIDAALESNPCDRPSLVDLSQAAAPFT